MSTLTRHTKVVRAARVVLPLLALALLSSLFLLTQTPNPDAAIPYAEADVQLLAREQRLTAPRFAGVSSDGASFSIAADLARPDPTDPRILSADRLSVAIDGLEGDNTLFVQAQRGQMDTGAQTLQLAQEVGIRSSHGLSLQTDQLMADVAGLSLYVPTPLTGRGPFGELTAQSMRLTRDIATGDQLLLFEGGVTLLYAPE